MPKMRRLPTAADKTLVNELKAVIADHENLRDKRQLLILEANRRGLSARTLAEIVEKPEGTLISWLSQARASAANLE